MAVDTKTIDSMAQTQGQTSAALQDYIELLRPAHWVKNVVVFAGPAAGMALVSVDSFARATIAFAAFCLAASGVYAINDVLDRKSDASHPTKRHRGVARGAIRPAAAATVGTALILAAGALTTFALDRWVTGVVGLYFVISLAYSLSLKRRVILDVIIIATGFVLRAWAGSLAVGVTTSEWLVVCVFTLCLFMGFGKRRCELAMLSNAQDAGQHRHTLIRYTPQLLAHLITVSAGIAVMTFLLYTLDNTRSLAPFPKEHLFYTLPIVVYGVFRFAMLTETGRYSGPTEIVLKDRALAGAILLWTTVALLIAYQQTLWGPGGLPGVFGRGGAG